MPEVKVKIEFNTSDGSGAKYYVTQVQIPADQAKTTVTYTLVDDSGATVTGTYTYYNNTTSFSCKVGGFAPKIRGRWCNCFVQSLEYQTILGRNKYYHTDVTHNYRNAIGTPGSYQGYIEGTVDATASAKMAISAVDENGKITRDGKTRTDCNRNQYDIRLGLYFNGNLRSYAG